MNTFCNFAASLVTSHQVSKSSTDKRKKSLENRPKAGFSLGEFVRANREKSNLIGWRQTLTSSPANHIRFLHVRANKFAKWKTGLTVYVFHIFTGSIFPHDARCSSKTGISQALVASLNVFPSLTGSEDKDECERSEFVHLLDRHSCTSKEKGARLNAVFLAVDEKNVYATVDCVLSCIDK